MDFLHKKLTAALNELRREIASLRESIDTAGNQQQRHYEEEHAQRELPSQAIRVDAETHERPDAEIEQRTYRNSSLRAQQITAYSTSAAFIAAAIYAGIAAWQLKTSRDLLKETRTDAAVQFTKMETANRIAFEANRPWVGNIPQQPGEPPISSLHYGKDQFGEYEETEYDWVFKNVGRRAAKIERIRETANWFNAEQCTENPDWNFVPPHTTRSPSMPHNSQALLVPDVAIRSRFNFFIPMNKWRLMIQLPPRLYFCIYSRIEYRDVGDISSTHHTQDCRVMSFLYQSDGSLTTAYAECGNKFPSAD